MATKIRETPVLTGKDAELFLKKIKENESNRYSTDKINEIKLNYEKIKSLTKLIVI